MKEYSSNEVKTLIQSELENTLEPMLREGVRPVLQTALEMEVASYLEADWEDRDASGHQSVVRNGYHRERTLVSGVVSLSIQESRVHDLYEEIIGLQCDPATLYGTYSQC